MQIQRLMLITLALCVCMALSQADAIEYRFFIGMTDGSEQSPDGVEYIVKIEADGDPVEVFREPWHNQAWTEEKVVDLNPWGGQVITLVTIASPGVDRNTGWDWIAIGEPRITMNDETIVDLLEIADQAQISMLLDDDTDETGGLDFGATFDPGDRDAGGETKPSFFQHPAWDGRVGDTIARFEIDLTGFETPVKPLGKLATAWAKVKAQR